MRRGIFTLCCITLFYGCGLFQRTKTSNLRSVLESKEESVKTAQLNTKYQSVGWSLSRMDDSLNSSSKVVIWPKGEFSFSPSGGFSGMAEKVVITGQLNSGRKQVAEEIQLTEQTDQLLLKDAETNEVLKDEKERIKERFPVSGWWLLLLIPILLGLNWLIPTGKLSAK